MDKKSIKELYKIIRNWELYEGEGFIEYFGDNYSPIKEEDMMNWLLKKGYIDFKKIESFKNANYIDMCQCLIGYETDFSLFPYGECNEEAIFKAELIMVEYIYENNLEEKLNDFVFNGAGWASFDSKEDKENYQNGLRKQIATWDKEDEEEYNKILTLDINELNKELYRVENK